MSMQESELLNDLLGFIEEIDEEELGLSEIENEGYAIGSVEQANYIIKQCKELTLEIDKINATAKQSLQVYQAKIDAWKESTINPLAGLIERNNRLLQSYGAKQLEGSTKKSLKLIEGTLQFIQPSDKFEYDDEKLLKFIQDNLRTYIRTKEEVNKVTLKEAGEVKDRRLYIDGVLVDGVEIVPQSLKFMVK